MGYFLGAGVWRLWPRTCLYISAPDVGAVTAIVFALGYSALADFSLPTQRALIMLGAVMLALVLRRRVQPSSTLALALFIVLLIDPISVTQAGFWLSFIAVGLLLFTLDRNTGDARIAQWGRAQWVLLIGLLPLNLLFFQGTPLVSPVANLIAIPWIGMIVLPLSLLGTFLLGLGFESGALLLRLADYSLGLIWPVLEGLQGIPISWMAMPAPSMGILVLTGLAIIMLLAPSGWPGRLMGVLFLLPLFLMQTPRPESGGFWLEILDVGEGLAIVIHTREHSLVYDTGPRFSPRFDTGSAVVLPYLYQHQIHQINTLIISHGDNDHIGGANSLIEGIPVKQLLSSVPAEKLPAEAHPCLDGQAWNWDGVDFQILHPITNWPYEGNNRSCVLKVSNDSHSVLLTGDIESISEFRLRKDHKDALNSDILLVPHHGSLTSSTQAFITAVAPDLAVVSSGYRNRFGFPKAEVLERYASKGVPVMNTADFGAIHIMFGVDDHPPRIEPYLDQYQRYWYSGLEPSS
jgi:competence protein ComEC